jgi:hypothetical protein
MPALPTPAAAIGAAAAVTGAVVAVTGAVVAAEATGKPDVSLIKSDLLPQVSDHFVRELFAVIEVVVFTRAHRRRWAGTQ